MPKTELKAKSVSLKRNIIGSVSGGAAAVYSSGGSGLPIGSENDTLRYDNTGNWTATNLVEIRTDGVSINDGVNVANGITVEQSNSGYASIPINTTNFDKNLSSTDDTLQKCLETLDELSTGGSSELVNYEILTSSSKHLIDTDKVIQIYENQSGSDITIYLPSDIYPPTSTLTEGLRFRFYNNSEEVGNYAILIYDENNDVFFNELASGTYCEVVYDGTAWRAIDNNSYTNNNRLKTSYGYNSRAYDNATVYGTNTEANGNSVVIANSGIASNNGIAIGSEVNNNGMYYSTAFGFGTFNDRVNELRYNYSPMTIGNNFSSFNIIGIAEQDFASTSGEVFLDAISARLVLVNNSVLTMTAHFCIVDIATGDAGHIIFTRIPIKNIGGTVTIPTFGITKLSILDAAINTATITLSADDTNNALGIFFGGIAGKTLRVGGHFRIHDLRY